MLAQVRPANDPPLRHGEGERREGRARWGQVMAVPSPVRLTADVAARLAVAVRDLLAGRPGGCTARGDFTDRGDFAAGLGVALAFGFGLAVAFAFGFGLAVAFAFGFGLTVAFALAVTFGLALAVAVGFASACWVGAGSAAASTSSQASR